MTLWRVVLRKSASADTMMKGLCVSRSYRTSPFTVARPPSHFGAQRRGTTIRMPSSSECTFGSSELGYCLHPSSAGSVLRRLATVPPPSAALASPPAAVGDDSADRPRVGYLHGGVCQARLRRCRWRGGGVPPSQGRCTELDTSGCGCGAHSHRCVMVAIGGAHGGSARRPDSVGQVDAVLRHERPQRRSSAREHAVAGYGRGQRQEHADDHQQLHQERLRPCTQPHPSQRSASVPMAQQGPVGSLN